MRDGVRSGRRQGLSLHILDDEGLLLDARGSRLYRAQHHGGLPLVSARGWSRSAGHDRCLRRTFGVLRRSCREAVSGLVREWRALGLLEGAPDPGEVDRLGGSCVLPVAFDGPASRRNALASHLGRLLPARLLEPDSCDAPSRSWRRSSPSMADPSPIEALVVADGAEALVVIDGLVAQLLRRFGRAGLDTEGGARCRRA